MAPPPKSAPPHTADGAVSPSPPHTSTSIAETASDAPATPLPVFQLVIVFTLFICDSFSFTTLAPYLAYMVRDFDLIPQDDPKRDQKLGYFAGMVATSYYVAQFFSAFFWGWVSDRLGRRPVLLFGVLISAVTSLSFGFSRSLLWAVGSRFVFGMANGNLGVFKTYLAEITDKTNQSRAFSFIGLSWSLGNILGPIIGGLTARPLQQYPAVFRWLNESIPGFQATATAFLTRYPYVLPNLFVSMQAFGCFMLGIFFLKESNKEILRKKRGKEVQEHVQMQVQEEREDVELEQVDLGADMDTEQIAPQEMGMSERESTVPVTPQRSVDMEDTIARSSSRGEGGGREDRESQDEVPPQGNQEAEMQRDLESANNRRGPYVRTKEFVIQLRHDEILASRVPMMTVLLYGFSGVGSIVFAEVMPLWLLLPPEMMGLSYGPAHLGVLNSVSGVAMLLFNTFCTHRILNRVGMLRSFQIGAVIMVPLFPFFPQIARLASWPAVAWCLVALAFTLRYASSQITFTSINIMINNSVTSKSMGTLNGVSQSVVALMRSAAPLMIGSLFALSVSVSIPILFDVNFSFYMLSALHTTMLLIAWRLPHSLNEPKEETESHMVARAPQQEDKSVEVEVEVETEYQDEPLLTR